ncbi:bifunctional oligoribonuclease/PAP phosphatase NrnA [bacterium]|nr:bifunctional oligoribonuclease/PAP phosphatase NrnA [bacterium]
MTAEHIKTYQTIAQALQEKNNFLITTHVRPDGDSIASVLILSEILNCYQKHYCILIDDCIPKKLYYLEGIQRIQKYDQKEVCDVCENVLTLDSSDLDRIGSVKSLISGDQTIINIDHHPGNTHFGHINLVDADKSSTAELVYHLVKFSGTAWTPAMATMIYTGIFSDTGRFLFANTSADALFICAEMVRYGANPSHISEMLYNRNTPETMRAYAKALSSLEFHFDNQITCMVLENEYLCHSGPVDTEGFVDTIAGIDGVKASFFMMEKDHHEFRVSFRSKGLIDVNQVASEFGGGGHIRASGCELTGSLSQVKQKILEVLKHYLNEKY